MCVGVLICVELCVLQKTVYVGLVLFWLNSCVVSGLWPCCLLCAHVARLCVVVWWECVHGCLSLVGAVLVPVWARFDPNMV